MCVMQHGHGSASQVIASSAMLAEPQWGFCLNFQAGVGLLLISALPIENPSSYGHKNWLLNIFKFRYNNQNSLTVFSRIAPAVDEEEVSS
jgi:hypothetical protein